MSFRLQRSQDGNQKLVEQLRLQRSELEAPKTRYDDLRTATLSLQNQLNILKQQCQGSSTQNASRSPQNGTEYIEFVDCINALRAKEAVKGG